MTMHLDNRLTTTSTKKLTEKITKAKLVELQSGWRERNFRLKDMHLPKETFEQYMVWVYGKGKKTKNNRQAQPCSSFGSRPKLQGNPQDEKANDQPGNRSRPRIWVTGACASKPSPVYTGTNMIGIGQMAKSNAVPVFNTDHIIEIARMRR